jgi:hypothetical protein
MHESRVEETLAKHDLLIFVYKKHGSCMIENRFFLHVYFDDHHHLCQKTINESASTRPQMPIYIEYIAWKIGLPVDGLKRSWP